MMQTSSNKIVLAITGASGSIYAKRLIQKLSLIQDQFQEVGVVISKNAQDVWQHELQEDALSQIPFKVYDKQNFYAPFASGSAKYNIMIVCPCSMGTMARIANGVSDDLVTRAADVVLKERRKLILVTRDTPLSLIHINNMKTITEAGGIICPASPSFYSKAQTLADLADTVVDRVLDLAGLTIDAYRWGEK